MYYDWQANGFFENKFSVLNTSIWKANWCVAIIIICSAKYRENMESAKSLKDSVFTFTWIFLKKKRDNFSLLLVNPTVILIDILEIWDKAT